MNDKPKGLFSKISGWFSKKPQTKATWIMVFISLVMVGTLRQNQKAIKNAMDSLELQKIATSNAVHQIEIEEETRLNPELQCAYDWAHDVFLFRNVGTTAAKNIFLQTAVYSVRSNDVMRLEPFRRDSGNILPPLEKDILFPGETANARGIYVPDKKWVADFWEKYGGEILVRVFVEYEGINPGYHRYSGYFNFTMNSTPDFAKDTSDTSSVRFLTEEEEPSLQKTIEQFYATPRRQFKEVAWFKTNDMEEVPAGLNDFGVNPIVSMRSNGVFVLGSWAKHH